MADSAERAPADALAPPSGMHYQLYRQGADAGVRWRLLSANNRDMGRGAAEYIDEEACILGIKLLMAGIGGLVTALHRAPDNRWAFKLMAGDQVMVTSAHAFDRRNRCEVAAARFVQLAPGAELRPGVALLPPAAFARGAVHPAPVGHPNVGNRWSPMRSSSPRWGRRDA
jgi:hypothetical protein